MTSWGYSMTTRTDSRIARLLALLLTGSGVASTAVAQGTAPPHGMMALHSCNMADSSGMMTGPHHLLAMAYRGNLMTFGRVLHDDVERSGTVNPELARPALAEMRRSFDWLRGHHEEQMKITGGPMKSPMPGMMSGMMQGRETPLRSLGEMVQALEKEVQSRAPDPAKVLDRTSAILKHCEGMMK